MMDLAISRAIGKRRGACWLMGFMMSLAQLATADDNVLGLPAKALESKGALIIGGGGHLADEVYDTFVELAGGKQARIVVIPTAYPFRSPDHAKDFYSDWFQRELQSCDLLDTQSRHDAESDSFARPLTRATGVWIGGGDQGRLADMYLNTKVDQAIRAVFERGGVVGGTSAGASFLSSVMIRGGTHSKAKVSKGLGLLERAVIDQHFRQRQRQERLLGVLEEHPELIGLGIDVRTALLVQGNRLRVLGDSEVVVCSGAGEGHRVWSETLAPGDRAELVVRKPNEDEPESIALALHREKK